MASASGEGPAILAANRALGGLRGIISATGMSPRGGPFTSLPLYRRTARAVPLPEVKGYAYKHLIII